MSEKRPIFLFYHFTTSLSVEEKVVWMLGASLRKFEEVRIGSRSIPGEIFESHTVFVPQLQNTFIFREPSAHSS